MGKYVEKKEKKENKAKKAKNSMEVEQPKPAEKQKIQIKKKLKKTLLNKKFIKSEPTKQVKQPQKESINKSEVFKQFNTQISQTLNVPKNATKGQKHRLERKNKVLKRKLLDKFLKEKKKSNTFTFDQLREGLDGIPLEPPKPVDTNKGTATHLRQKILQKDQVAMKQVMNIKEFKQNPLETMRLHLQNTYKQQGK